MRNIPAGYSTLPVGLSEIRHHDATKKHDKQHDNQHVEKQKPESVPTESGDKQPAE